MNPRRADRRLSIVGRVMQWLSSRPRGAACRPGAAYDGQLGHPDVLGEADRADGVEAGLRHVAVVVEADVDLVGQAASATAFCAPLGLLARQGHRDDVHAVVLGGVHRHAAPAAADVEQAHAWLKGELAADEVELLVLRLLQRRLRRG